VIQEAEMVERRDTPKRYVIRITTEANLGLPEISGYILKGRYVGLRFRGRSVNNSGVQKDAPVNVPGWGLWAQEGGATEFFGESNAARVQAQLKALGLESELVEVSAQGKVNP
jgi:hypothetical protein